MTKQLFEGEPKKYEDFLMMSQKMHANLILEYINHNFLVQLMFCITRSKVQIMRLSLKRPQKALVLNK